MYLTEEDGEVLLGAISVELDSQHWRQMRREEYNPPLPRDVEQSLRDEDAARASVLRDIRDKIRRQLSPPTRRVNN